MAMRAKGRRGGLALVVLVAVAGAARADVDGREAALALERAAAVEQALLSDAARQQAEALAAQRAAADRVARLAAQGEALVREVLLAGDLEPGDVASARQRLDDAWSELDRARGEEAAQAARALAARASVGEHGLRWQALLAEVAQLRERARTVEPLDGSWEVRLGPMDDRGLFELDQDGTLLSGRYAQASGRNGSLTGTFIDGKVQLEQVDSRLGRHAIFYGVWSPGDHALRGTWESRLLGTGQPAHGTWVAVQRVADEAAETAEPDLPDATTAEPSQP